MACQCGKPVAKQRRRKIHPTVMTKGKSGDKVTAYWMVTKKGRAVDWAGAKNALVFYDLSAQYKAVYVAARRTKLRTLEAFNLFSPGKVASICLDATGAGSSLPRPERRDGR